MKKTRFRRLLAVLAIFQAISFLTGCGGGTAGSGSSGAAPLALVEAPFSYFRSPRETAAALNSGESHLISFNSVAFFKLQVGDVFQIQLPGLGAVHVTVDSRDVHYGQAVSIVGSVAEAAGAVVRLSGRGSAIKGAIQVGGTEWQVHSSPDRATLQNEKAAGISEMTSHTPADYERYMDSLRKSAPVISPAQVPQGLDAALTPPPFSYPLSANAKSETAREKPRLTSASNVATIDLLIVSDRSYRDSLGGQDFELADIANLVSYANKAMSDSFTFTQYRTVGYIPLEADWSSSSMTSIKSEMGSSTGSVSRSWPQRIATGADLVVAMTRFNDAKASTCGLGDLGTYSGDTFSSATGSASAVVARGTRTSDNAACRDSTFAHELGHILGSEHDLANSTSAPAFSFSHGYGIAGQFGDIMSYITPRLPYFSSPGLKACAGYACGTDAADSVRTFRYTATDVSSAMTSVSQLSGIYWDPSASGTGWTIEASGSKVLVGAFTYDSLGASTWTTGVGTPCPTAPKSYCVGLDEYQGGQTLTGPAKVTSLKRRVTDAVLTFSSAYPATLTVQMGTVTKQLQRFVFNASAGLTQQPTWPGPSLPGTYWNTGAPGTGIYMERQGDTIVATYFYFRSDGSAAWSSVTGRNWVPTSSGSVQSAQLSFVTYSGGQSLLGSYRAPVVQNANEANTYMGVGVTGSFTVWNSAGVRQSEKWSKFVF